MRLYHKLYKFLALTLVLGISITNYVPVRSHHIASSPISQDQNNRLTAPVSEEIILIWNAEVTKADKESYLQPFGNQISITKEYEDYMLITAKDKNTSQSLYDQLVYSQDIASIDYNHEIELSYTNDAYSSAQWGLENPGYYTQLVGDQLIIQNASKNVDLDIPEAWSIYNKKDIKTREVVVAVIDTGVDNNHPDLANSMWINKGELPDDGIDNDHNGYIDDIFGWDFYNNDNTICHYEMDVETEEIRASSDDNDDHGTHCAGIIAATANNNIGIAGVASNINVKIMSLKIHGGPKGKGSIADAILAIKYATAMGADVVNVSWGSQVYSKALEQTIAQSPMLFVTAAGNSGDNNDSIAMYPANYNLPNVMSVTFINEYGALTTKSNYGKKTVDIAAPGMNILSTAVGSYATLSGSSMAAPHITGLAAILYSCSKNLSPKSVKDVIVMNVKPLINLRNSIANAGIPDAFLMVQSMPHLVIDKKAPTLHINTYFEQNKIMLGLYPNDKGNSGICVIRYLSGKKDLKAFKKGTTGTEVLGSTLSLNKSGMYTFYVSDYAGNENIYQYNVIDDVKAPLVSTSYRYSMNNAVTLNINVIDELSDVKLLRYAFGNKTVSDFVSGSIGTTLTLKDDMCTIRLTKPGIYSFYAVDYRGNKTVHAINIVQKPITALSVAQNSYNLNINDTLKLKLTYEPANTTDKIYYISSAPSVVSVSQWGTLHGKSSGKAIITIQSTSGRFQKVLVTVN